MSDDLEEDNARILAAARTINSELGDDTMGLDELIAEAEADDEDEDARAFAVDEIVVALRGHPAARERFEQLLPDVERGVAGDIWAGDMKLAAGERDPSSLLALRCRTCGFVNRLAYRPTDDDLPQCLNPDPPPHELKLR